MTGDDGSATEATLSQPTGLAMVPYAAVWVADIGNNRVRMVGIAPAPTTTTTIAATTTVGHTV